MAALLSWAGHWAWQIVAALAVGVCLAAIVTLTWLFLRIMAKIGELSRKTGQIRDVAAVASSLNQRIEALEQQSRGNAEWASQLESVNLNRRGQVLRLHRRGDSVSAIASALRLRPGEVKLMIKVHEFTPQSSN